MFSEADHLRGSYGPYRSNNDLLYYHLDVRVDPGTEYLSGKNSIRFKMLRDGTRIQLDLVPVFHIEKILLDQMHGAPLPLQFERAAGRTVYIDFPNTLRKGRLYTVEFYYSGHPVEMGRFGGFVFRKDPMGRPLVNTACEEEGASVWWPNKDQWRDEVESMDISVEAPSDLVEVSGGRFQGKQVLPDGYTRWNWHVSYPINNYDVSLNIGKYAHFDDHYGDLTLDYYVFPEDLDKARRQFVQVKDMLNAFTFDFGGYPFPKDGYKLIEALYSGVENQTAITYGNHFENGYLGRPKQGIGTWFDFIIVHESAHEWFGNSITAKDRSDMWIHEGWANYSETLFVEYMWGKRDAITYLNTGKDKVKNESPVISEEGVFSTPPPDQYKKGALFLNTLRSVIDDDRKWFALIRAYYRHFKYQTIMTTDMLAFFDQYTGRQLRPIFDQYLRHAEIPTLALRFDAAAGSVAYRWIAQETEFAMPVRVGRENQWQLIHPTTSWQSMRTGIGKDDFEAATDFYYINVSKQ
ncbi:MAG TPA: M1 family metallopeptidase [Steroidobacteraceae bacterium]|nr:M1 family metallopeptidase [Steroidobacteraceae bacterium]